MKQIKKFKLKDFKKNGGRLIAIPFNKKFFFKVERIFYIYGKKFLKRGNHAHKKCSQVFYPLFGKFQIAIQSKKIKKIISLDSKKNKAILVHPKTWCHVKFLTKNAIILVLCDYKYDFKDYIESYEDFVNNY